MKYVLDLGARRSDRSGVAIATTIHSRTRRPRTMQAVTITTERQTPVRLPPPHGATAEAAEDLRIARRAVSAFFLLLGVAVATWAALVPFAKSSLRLDEGTL